MHIKQRVAPSSLPLPHVLQQFCMKPSKTRQAGGGVGRVVLEGKASQDGNPGSGRRREGRQAGAATRPFPLFPWSPYPRTVSALRKPLYPCRGGGGIAHSTWGVKASARVGRSISVVLAYTASALSTAARQALHANTAITARKTLQASTAASTACM